MSEHFVLDAWGILAFLQGEEPAANRVQQLFEAAQAGQIELSISIINLGEVYYRVGRAKDLAEANKTLAGLRQLTLDIFPSEDEQVFNAARLKAVYAISYADAFALAAARQLNATLVTGDPELLNLEDSWRFEVLKRG
jgi:predicted nucleic acid-binding protein